MESIQPFPKKLLEKAESLHIKSITLQWQGGSDEGHLYVDINPSNSQTYTLNTEIEDWAYNAYAYSGAGDGSPYGDNISYNFENKTATCTSWYSTTTTCEGVPKPLPIELEEEE